MWVPKHTCNQLDYFAKSSIPYSIFAFTKYNQNISLNIYVIDQQKIAHNSEVEEKNKWLTHTFTNKN